MLKQLVGLLTLCALLGGVMYFARSKQQNDAGWAAKFEKDLRNPSVPPTLSDIQQDPDWSIRRWIGVGIENRDCKMADEMMDQNATIKTMRRRRMVREYHLVDYIAGCRDSNAGMIRDIVEPQAKKWCQYRNTSPRLDELCNEWLEKTPKYLEAIRAMAEPTLKRYESFCEMMACEQR